MNDLKHDTLALARKTSFKHPGLKGWAIDGDNVTVEAGIEAEMKGRFEALSAQLNDSGLQWRTDSRLLKKHVRCGKPDADVLVKMLICMKFLHEKTIYADIKKTVHFSHRVYYENMIRLHAISAFLADGGAFDSIPQELQELWSSHASRTPQPPPRPAT